MWLDLHPPCHPPPTQIGAWRLGEDLGVGFSLALLQKRKTFHIWSFLSLLPFLSLASLVLQTLPLYGISVTFFFSQTEVEKNQKAKGHRREQGEVTKQKGKKSPAKALCVRSWGAGQEMACGISSLITPFEVAGSCFCPDCKSQASVQPTPAPWDPLPREGEHPEHEAAAAVCTSS